MVFNSLTFLIFLAIVLAAYHSTGSRARKIILVVASYVFYGWWDWRFLGLLFLTTAFDYTCALLIDGSSTRRKKQAILTASIVVNLATIGFFKYFNFFADSFSKVLLALGMTPDFPTLYVILPVGISFYTFLSMSYTIDVFRGHVKAARNPLDFMLYVSFFPHLVAGPIVRAQDLLPQCVNPPTPRRDQIVTGIWLCILGYLKKVVIADRLAPLVEQGFSGGQTPFEDANSWLFLYAFAFQIYGDFAGYSDIARGLAKLMGFELVHNFKAPYLVGNPAAFWRHWHISLSVWLRDYLYIPLGGNRHGTLKTVRNLMVTMILGGLWHGAGIAFLAWGFYQGCLLVFHRGWIALKSRIFGSGDRNSTSRPFSGLTTLGKCVVTILFFHLTCLGWLLFRAGALAGDKVQWNAISSYWATLFTLPRELHSIAWPIGLLGGLALILQWKHATMDHFHEWPARRQALCVTAALVAITTIGVFEGSSFIYFQF